MVFYNLVSTACFVRFYVNVPLHAAMQAALLRQVLSLTEDQIQMLPPEQRSSILKLKDQIARSL